MPRSPADGPYADPMSRAEGGTTDTIVEAVELTLAYGDHLAVCDASFALPQGRVTAIIGPNGSGKTTLLRAISGLEPLLRGSLHVGGAQATELRGRVAHVMQSTRVNEAVPLTVIEVVRMGRYRPRRLLSRLDAKDHERVAEGLDRMHITDLADRQLRELSGGQQQRVYVAQGLAQNADVLLLDEPITGLDIQSQEHIDRAIHDEVAKGRTVIFTTHDVATAGRADHVLLLATHLVASGPPGQVLTDENLGTAYGARAYRTAEGTLIIGDPHVHGRKEPTPHDHG